MENFINDLQAKKVSANTNVNNYPIYSVNSLTPMRKVASEKVTSFNTPDKNSDGKKKDKKSVAVRNYISKKSKNIIPTTFTSKGKILSLNHASFGLSLF